MLTVASAAEGNYLVKRYYQDGTSDGATPIMSATLKRYDPQTPDELIQIFKDLKYNEAIISGITNSPQLSYNHRRTLDNFTFEGSVWLPFDRDYTTTHDNDKDTTPYIELLADVDPQLKHISYAFKHSASNILLDSEPLNPHRSKIWVQFKPGSTTKQIKAYAHAFYIKAFLKGYQHVFFSKSERALPTPYLRTLFDTTVFSPERWNYEGEPYTELPYEHNTHYSSHYGEQTYVDPEALKLTAFEQSSYDKLEQSIKHSYKDEIQARKDKLRKLFPQQNYDAIDSGILTYDTVLYTDDNTEISVLDIIEAYVYIREADLKQYLNTSFRDPLEPDYGPGKARLYFNEDSSLVLHSFAHGSHYFKLMPAISYLPEALEARGGTLDKKASRREKIESMNLLKQIAPNFYAADDFSLVAAAEDLKGLSSLPVIKNLLTSVSHNYKSVAKAKRLRDKTNPLHSYYYYKEGSGSVVIYDAEQGLKSSSVASIKYWLAHQVQEGETVEELFDEWISDPNLNVASRFGLYPPDTEDVMNTWLGFNVSPTPHVVSSSEIQPFISYIKLITDGDTQGVDYVLDWLADLVQNPLRAEDARTAIVLQSDAKGTGKSTFVHLISTFFQPSNTATYSKLSRLVGQFNARLMPVVFMGLEEVANDTAYQIPAIKTMLRDMLTNDKMEIEKKGLDSITVPNRLHVVFTTNAEFIFFDANDRRFTVFEVPTHKQNDKIYFGELHSWWNDRGREKTYTYLMQRKYQTASITESYKGSATIAASVRRLYNLDAWLFFLLQTPASYIELGAGDLYTNYIQWAEDEGLASDKRIPTKNALTKALRTKFDGVIGFQFAQQRSKFRFDISAFRIRFAEKVLNAPNMDWSPFLLANEEELNLKKEDVTL